MKREPTGMVLRLMFILQRKFAVLSFFFFKVETHQPC